MNSLLHTPEGVRDIYNADCKDKLYIQEKIRQLVKSFGYLDVEGPSFEYFDIFNKERGSIASKEMYKFFDKEGNTLVLRPDMTPQIARIAAKYYESEEAPVKLCYQGRKFVNCSSYQGRLK
ncbi:MAG: ATP phosphoribosyltransferase regulatory subunit, partial [Alistipes sp.]|nr:ATP phosphoribosyltransferase regulatory subunit [Alistipes sp.]